MLGLPPAAACSQCAQLAVASSCSLLYLQAWKTAGGHILVKPRIDGQDVGFMILDTGAPACHSL